jgi:hypothetical protein
MQFLQNFYLWKKLFGVQVQGVKNAPLEKNPRYNTASLP